ncbi:hypothetical protein [Halogeometricum sp. CBA1124]|uniref:hypothetical protein n=1 Tax=Halogeometricum sp. CBA1124 TaxID=2668071 RepID=UPI00142C5E45|nr:hypothetical protein [Halogeometricum sp. CBA1124]MUV58872.1 hypothetical protein [Halogeometricum sp. CBA1124]
MERTVDLSGDSLARFLYASQLTALLLVVFFVVDGVAGVAVAVLFASLSAAAAVGLWRTVRDREGGERLGTADDITYDPFADPGQAARDRWEKAVRRLPGGDDERD